MTDLAGLIVDISNRIDAAYPPDLSPETHMWRRCMKVSEEVGEVTEALFGIVGENPRKGVTHAVEDLRYELLDVALAALGAVAHLGLDDPIEALTEHTRTVQGRLVLALARTAKEGDQ